MIDRAREPLLSEPGRRVILVGQTGLDQALRKDASLEIVRATDGLGALGELSDPPSGLENATPVVIVGRTSAAGEAAGSNAEFVGALRTIDPRVRVLATAGAAHDQTDPFSAVVPESASAEEVLRLAEAELPAQSRVASPRSPADEPQPEPRPEPDPDPDVCFESEPGPEPSTEADRAGGPIPEPPADPVSQLSDAESGDAPLVGALLRGEPVLPVALALLQRRLGAPGLGQAETEPEPGHGAALTIGERAHSWLVDDDGVCDPAELARHASWLSEWLRLETRHLELRTAAFTDPLTGAWNRRYFDRYLEATINRARPARLPVTVMVFDLDGFKSFNDQYGHGAGDEILCETVRLLGSVIRPTDRVCRVGGDEFAVIFYEPGGPRTEGSAPPASISQIARRFQRQICAHRFPRLGAELEDTLTISGGLATFPWDGQTPDQLVRAADELSLRSKRAGKNALTFGHGAELICRTEFDEDD